MTVRETRYLKHWDSYWRQIEKGGSQMRVLWESDPERSAREDMARFEPHMDEELPLLDLGCGSGKQTRFLAQRFQRVIGVDISPTVVERAQRAAVNDENVEFRVLNALNQADAAMLHQEVGDMNIYMRGVFHVINEPDRHDFVATLETLLGQKGTLYQIELTVEALDYVRSISHDSSLRFPKVVQPTGFNNNRDRETYFPPDRWLIVDEGENATLHTVTLINGEEGAVPANYLILRRKSH